MSSITAMNQGISAIQAGLSGLRADASAIAGSAQQPAAGTSGRDLSQPLLNLNQDKLLVQAGAKVVEAADKTIGTLIDITA